MVYLSKGPIQDVLAERERQDAEWGEQNHTSVWWHAILSEEVGEVAKAVLEAQFAGGSVETIRAEMVQVAAVAIAAIESIDRGEL